MVKLEKIIFGGWRGGGGEGRGEDLPVDDVVSSYVDFHQRKKELP